MAFCLLINKTKEQGSQDWTQSYSWKYIVHLIFPGNSKYNEVNTKDHTDTVDSHFQWE